MREVGFTQVEWVPFTCAGKERGDVDPFLEKVIETEPHACLVAVKSIGDK